MTQVHNDKVPLFRDDGTTESLLPRLQRIGRFLSAPLFLACMLFFVALGFDLYRLGAPSIWYDEAFSVELARLPLPQLWHIISGPEPNMELYYLFLHFWLGLTGALCLHATEFVVRLPSAVFAALSTVVVFLLGRRFIGTIAGFAGAGFYLLNNLQLVYAQQTRAYSLQLLLICIAWYALLSALSTPSRRWWACYIVATTLAVYTHLFSVLILLAQVVMFAGLLILPGERQKSLRRLRGFLLSLAITGVLIIPMLLVSRNGSKTGWLPIPHLSDVYHLLLTISANSRLYLLAIAACCAFGLLVVCLCSLPAGRALLQRNTLHDEKSAQTMHSLLPIALALVCWLVVPIVASYVISYTPTRLFSSRYLVTIVPALALLMGLGIAALGRRGVSQVAITLILLLLFARYVPLYYQSAQVEDWNTTTHWLQQRYQANDGMVCYANSQGCQISVEYYLHAYPSAAHFTPDSPGAYSWTNFGPVDPVAGYEAAVDPQALAAYGAKHSRLFFIVGRVPDAPSEAKVMAAQQWLDSHYHLVDQIVTRTVTIRLYATNVQTMQKPLS
ncbi:MAG TPA: glycosyltransferase family 39 protein [Ktedonobacteraceae bacterium]|nr:glycosyltransferase family 39 protein [Ktedonobacteraceae bacterium]